MHTAKHPVPWRFLFALFAFFAVNSPAAQVITATITITNATPLNGTNGATITVNSNVRTWTNSVFSPGTQIHVSTNIAADVQAFLTAAETYPFAGPLTPGGDLQTYVTLRGTNDQTLTVSFSPTNWAKVIYSTQTVGAASAAVRLPFPGDGSNRVWMASKMIEELNSLATNAFLLSVQQAGAWSWSMAGSTVGVTTTNLDPVTNVFLRLTGPTNDFTILGVAGGTAGRMVGLINASTNRIFLTNDSPLAPTNSRILTLDGGVDTISTNGWTLLVYDANTNRWLMLSSGGSGGGGSSLWVDDNIIHLSTYPAAIGFSNNYVTIGLSNAGSAFGLGGGSFSAGDAPYFLIAHETTNSRSVANNYILEYANGSASHYGLQVETFPGSAGYTGANSLEGSFYNRLSQNGGARLLRLGGFAGAVGVLGLANYHSFSGAINGESAGLFGFGHSDANLNYGAGFLAQPYYAGQTNVAVAAEAIKSTTGQFVGAYFGIATSTSGQPLYESASLLLDVHTSGQPLIIGRTNNGTSVFKVSHLGDLVLLKKVSYSWPSANDVGGLINDGAGNLSWSVTNLTYVHQPSNAAPFATVSPAALHSVALGQGWTNDLGARADLVLSVKYIDAASGDPRFAFTNSVTGEAWTNGVAFGLAGTNLQQVVIPDLSPNDSGSFTDLSGAGASVTFLGAWWKVK